MNCGRCGELNIERAKYCRLCGGDLKFEADRLPLEPLFFTIVVGIMIFLVLVSLIYFVVKFNFVEQKLNVVETCYVYNKM